MIFLNRLLLRVLGLCLLMVVTTTTTTMAAPGTMANSPLFTTNSVEPSVFFEVDGSGSMDWEILMKPFWQSCRYLRNNCGLYRTNGLYRARINGDSYNTFEYIFENTDNSYSTTCTDWQRGAIEKCTVDGIWQDPGGIWRVQTSSLNVMYYDPATTYLPWKNADGTSMANASFSAARSDPKSSAAGYTITRNLDGFVYHVWTDTHGWSGDRPDVDPRNRTVGANDVVDLWDEHVQYTVNTASIDVNATTYTESAGGIGYDQIVGATSNPATVHGRTLAEEQQNIANWYQYSRRRSFVTKAAIADVVQDSPSYRFGLNFINNHSFTYDGTAGIRFVEIPAGNGTVVNNQKLLDGLNSLDWPGSGTPLRLGLERAGIYFDNEDGRTNPISEQCQQNFAVLFTDGHWNGGNPDAAIGDADGDGYDRSVADVAKYYYDKDLDTSLDNNVVGNDADPATHQHLVTYTVAFGVDGELTKDNGYQWVAPDLPYEDAVAGGSPTPTRAEVGSEDWGDAPSAGTSPVKIDDLWHAAYNSTGTFVSASTPSEVSDAMTAALENISDRVGSAASVAFNTTTLTGDTAVYLAQFTSSNNKWSGDLLSFPLDPVTGDVSVSPNWRAAEVLDGRVNAVGTRRIFTYNGTDGVPFNWGRLTAPQKADLRKKPDGSLGNVARGRAVRRFLRGERDNEIGEGGTYSFRKREKLLGDIIHSDPVYVGAPELSWPDVAPFPTGAAKYSTFKEGAAASRTPMVYVGSNDGMLHGFRASDGSEMVAYIPGSLFSSSSATEGLHYLTDPSYSHRYYTDLPSTISDVYIDTDNGGGNSWHTVLLGGGRLGSKGIFALDITDPTSFGQNLANAQKLVLWEFDQTDDSDMGYSFSKPSIAMMNNGRWAAIFGNGYNSTGDGKASLFIVFLDGGIDGTWTDGSGASDLDYIKISTGVGSIVSSDCSDAGSDCNGLSSPQSVDMDGDKDVDRIYAGDLKGNMWVFDVSSANPNNWDSAYKTGASPEPLFTAVHGGTPQPITNKPILTIHPEGRGGDPDVLVFFGTGQYLTTGNVTNTDIQSFYGVWDNGSHSLAPSDLVEQTFLSETFLDDDGDDVSSQIRVLTDLDVDYAGADNGWVINLTESSGERVIVDADLRGELVYFNTWIPDSNPCNAGGSGVLMSVKQINGGAPDEAAFDLNGDGVVDVDDMVSVTSGGTTTTHAPSGESYGSGLPASSSFLSNYQYTPGTDGGSTIEKRSVEDLSGSESGRISWQELRR